MNAENMRSMLLYVSDKVIESKSYLTEIDSAIGDGDHGIGMENGFKSARVALEALPHDATIQQQFISVGKNMLITMGGASGALFGTLFSSIGKAAPASDECSADAFANMLRVGLDGVKARGNAQIGDKTMVDSLEPAADAAQKNCGSGFAAMLEAASAAAWDGVEATKNMQAKFGRAKTLMERSLGHQDAGATSIAIIMRSMAEFAKQNEIY